MHEIEAISDSFTKIESRHALQTSLVSAKDEQITKLLAGRTKYVQKIQSLEKDREIQNGKTQALTKHATRQKELIQRLEEESVSREHHLAALEREMIQLKALVGLHERKAIDMMQLAEEMTLKLDKSGSKNAQVYSNRGYRLMADCGTDATTGKGFGCEQVEFAPDERRGAEIANQDSPLDAPTTKQSPLFGLHRGRVGCRRGSGDVAGIQKADAMQCMRTAHQEPRLDEVFACVLQGMYRFTIGDATTQVSYVCGNVWSRRC
jgi:hypothetical protein